MISAEHEVRKVFTKIQNVLNSIQSFKSSLEIFKNLQLIRGVAISQLGISKICHDRYNEFIIDKSPKEKAEFLSQCNSVVDNAIELFEELKFEEGKNQCLNLKKSFSGIKNTEINPEKNLEYKSMLQEDNSVMLGNI